MRVINQVTVSAIAIDHVDRDAARAVPERAVGVFLLLHRGRHVAVFNHDNLAALEEWGITSCEDFGQMVFLMVENGLLRKTEQDSPEDFKNGYSFHEAFRVPFLPAPKRPTPELPEQTHIEKN